MLKRFVLLLATLLAVGMLAWAEGEAGTLSWLDDPGVRIGVDQGSAAEGIARRQFPRARIEYFTDKPSGYQAVAQGKIDAFIYDYNQMRVAIESGLQGVRLLDETLGEPVRIAVGISPVTKIPDFTGKLNQFIDEIRTDGTLDDMYTRWVIQGEETMPDIPVPETSDIHLTVGTSGIVPPYSYYIGTGLSGYDIELARRFAAWLGAELEFKVYDYGAITSAAVTGDVDCVMANLNVTPERAESLPYSDVLYEEKIGVMVRGEAEAATKSDTAFTSLAQLNGRRIGVQTGASFDAMVAEQLPEAQVEYYNGKADLVAALTGQKIDAFVVDEPVAQILARESDQLTWLPEYLDSYEFALVFPKSEAGESLRDQFNAFMEQLPEGELDRLAAKWFGEDEAAKAMPDLAALSAENGTLRLATESGYAPFEYVRDGQVVGYDMELAALFCEYAGYGLEIVDMNFDGILPAVQTGKCDFAVAGISITPERAESVLFSEPNFSGGTVAVVLRNAQATAASGVRPEYAEFSDLSGKTVSMLTGAPFEELVKSKAPDVGEFTFFNNTPDMIQALKTQKTDAFLMNNAVSQLALNRNPDLALFPQRLQDGAFGIAFAKGDPRRDEWQAAYDAIPQTEIEKAWEKWTGADDSVKVLPEQNWPGLNGTVKVAACDTLEPMSYVGGDNELKGFDLEIILMMAHKLDVKVEFEGMEFSALLAAVQSGKADLGAGSIIITEERAQAVDFVEYYPAAFVLVVRTAKVETAEATGDGTTPSSIAASFEKTFIREDRWKLFAEGVLTTLLITALAILFGTALGFAIFMLCRGGNPVANSVTRFSMWLVQGMPMVVLLMILYYIIFGSVAISGIAVAVIGFTLTFGASVFGLLKMGVGAVDNGQYEAACALGYSDRRTFFKIVLPQALPHVLPAYRGEIVGLIKATAIVGYIAVQDLTKMGDIVRSRTYEAFFPLIAVTIIYFLLEGLIGFVIGRIAIDFNPKRRKPADILKGVKTDDPD